MSNNHCWSEKELKFAVFADFHGINTMADFRLPVSITEQCIRLTCAVARHSMVFPSYTYSRCKYPQTIDIVKMYKTS